jgi:hypothetical protein
MKVMHGKGVVQEELTLHIYCPGDRGSLTAFTLTHCFLFHSFVLRCIDETPEFARLP